MRSYQQIDIALGPFPFAGGTTSFDALPLMDTPRFVQEVEQQHRQRASGKAMSL
jgi:predicted O-linked N-acetylglucosamine transferase (SPINDLY family)